MSTLFRRSTRTHWTSLLKPVEMDRLGWPVTKLWRMLGEKSRPAYSGPAITRIPCVSSNRIKLIDSAEAEFVRSDVGGIYVVCGQGEFYTELTLKVIEARTNFVRCHKQFMVNIDRVDEILMQENQAALIQTRSKETVPVRTLCLKRIKELPGL